jgi:tripartite-type tricarboxylate transporter receptor subunit TctC
VGPGSLYHLMGEKFAAMTGLKMLHVPYKGGSQLITDVSGGQVDMAFFPLAGPVPGMIKEGRVKAIGIAAPTAHALFPDVPPMSKHRLLPDFNFDLWIGVQVPKATPEPVVARINQAMNEVIKNADVRKGLITTGNTVPGMVSQAELDKLYTSEVERYRALFKSINLQPQ